MNTTPSLPQLRLEPSLSWKDYQLLDSGDGKTLEQFGPYKLIRPRPQAIWPKTLPKSDWDAAHALWMEDNKEDLGRWKQLQPMEKSWQMSYGALKFQAQIASSRQVGVFPEQAAHWDWLMERIRKGKKPFKVLNLFGYTGLATLAAASAGAEVTHIDSSKHAISWANYNLHLSGLESKPVRWIAEDVLKFVQREARRGNRYQGIVMDPPKFGRGSSGEVWDFFKRIPELLKACRAILADDADFIILTAYAINASAITTHQAVHEIVGSRGSLTSGELVSIDASAGHMISHALFTRWNA